LKGVTNVADQQRSFGSRRLRHALVASDVIALSASWIIACLLGLNFPGAADQQVMFGVLLIAVTLGLFFTSRLYRSRMCSVRALETASVLRACLLGGLLAWTVAGRLSLTTVRVRAVIVAQLLAVVLVFIGRAIYRSALQRHRSNGQFARPVVLIGGGEEVYELNKMLTSEPELGYAVIGSIGTAGEMSAWATGLAYLGPLTSTVEIMQRHGASGAIVSGSGLSSREMNRVVREIMNAGMHVQLFGGLLGIDPSRLQVNPIGGEAAFYLEQVALTGLQSQVKRAVDIGLGLVGLILTAPIVAVFALLARLDGGTSFFRQVRVGRDGRTFTMIKIRTMVMDAEQQQAGLHGENERLGPLFKMDRDPRFTRLGRFMDATSINELPQFWNVVRGEMSLVGPRPALASEVATFNDRLLLRHQVRPGITGLWQIQGRDAASFATYERCDVFYVENWSTRLDMMILAQTAVHIVARATVWRRRAAMVRHPSETALPALTALPELPTTLGVFGDAGNTSGVTVSNG
jgi:exopolysaccharide biosynthesis polyprenyl glycosylphosphotransferase